MRHFASSGKYVGDPDRSQPMTIFFGRSKYVMYLLIAWVGAYGTLLVRESPAYALNALNPR